MFHYITNILLTAFIGGGAFYFLPWDIALALDVFLGMICLLVVYLKRHVVTEEKLNRLLESKDLASSPKSGKSKSALESTIREITQAKIKSPALEEKTNLTPIDPSVFGQFKKNSKDKKDLPKPVSSAKTSSKEDKVKDIIMAVSAQAKSLSKQKQSQSHQPSLSATAYGSKKPSRKKKKEEPLPEIHSEEFDPVSDDIFDDTLEKEFKSKTSKNRNKETLTSGEFLNLKDFKKDKSVQISDLKELLKELETCHDKNLHDDLLTRVEIFEAENTDCENLPDYGLIVFWKGMANFRLKNYQAAKVNWQHCFDKYLTSEHKDFADKIAKVVDLYKTFGVQKHGIPFLLTALNYHRRQSDYKVMDQLYHEITVAYDQLGDTKRLIESLRNHISIRKVLKDYSGQLDLVDRLGKIFYDQGNKQGTNYCYEQSLRIRQEMMEAGEEAP